MKRNIVAGMVTVGVIAVIGGSSFYYAQGIKNNPAGIESKGVTAKYTAMLGDESSANNLVALSEKEIFSKEKTIVKGVVTGIQNVVFSNGIDFTERAIATIKVNEVYQGDTKEQKIRVLLPCGIGTGVQAEDTSVVSAMKTGMTGIFVVERYDNGEYKEDVNGDRIYLSEVSEYGMMDGECNDGRN